MNADEARTIAARLWQKDKEEKCVGLAEGCMKGVYDQQFLPVQLLRSERLFLLLSKRMKMTLIVRDFNIEIGLRGTNPRTGPTSF